MCNIHEHAVLIDYMVPKGSSFIGKHGPDFVHANDLAWVGFSVETGPDGGVYILDWHDQNICGNVVKFANSARVYRIMPKGVKGPGPFDLEKLTDLELVEMQNHSNDWYVRQSRTILQHRYASGKLNAVKVHGNLESMMKKAKSVGKRLRALWALQVTGGFEGKDAELMALLDDSEQYVRSWAIQFLSEDKKPSDAMLAKFSKMAKSDPSPVVRLYLASALQRFPHDDRWSILEGLASHEEDKDDNNLPRMVWLALEPMVPDNSAKALTLAAKAKLPRLQEFVPRRMLAGKTPVGPPQKRKVSKADWQKLIRKAAPGFYGRRIGGGGVSTLRYLPKQDGYANPSDQAWRAFRT